MNLNPKKIAGRLGRRYGGKSFQRARKVFYDSIALCRQIRECYYLSRKKYAPRHPDRTFYDKYYAEQSDNSPEKGKEGFVMMLDGRMFHGGPTDRLRGILTTYKEVKKTGKPFYINWSSPFQLEDYLEPATFDWRIKPEELVYERRYAFPFIIEDEPDLHSLMRMKAGLKQFVRQIHVYSNADNGRGEYRQLYAELFKPSEALQHEVDRNLEKLGDRFSAYTFRFLALLGDFKEWSETTLAEEEQEPFMEKVFEEFRRLTVNNPKGEKILVTSDSRKFLDYIKMRDERVYVVDGDVKNIDLLKGEFKGAWMKTFTDQQLLMHAYQVTLMRTGGMYNSGFPRFAAEVGGGEYRDHKF